MAIRDEFNTEKKLSESDLEKLLSDWGSLSTNAHQETFLNLDRKSAEELFVHVSPMDQAELFGYLPLSEKRSWIRFLAPDDAVDIIQQFKGDERKEIIALLDPQTKTDVSALLAYKEDQAGGLMNSRFARIRPEMTVDESIRYLRAQTRSEVETIYYAFVMDRGQKLLGVASLRLLFTSRPDLRVSEIMIPVESMVVIKENQDQEETARIFSQYEYLALPVVDDQFCMKGIVTVDDVVQVVQEEATEDIQKFGGMQALDAPYFKISFLQMIRKRSGWLLILFVGEMFTATAMGYYEDEISKAVVLALFIPLIISSGGNSGSQASTLVIRAMALGEIRLRDWWRVLFRELASGLTLGFILGSIGLARIFFWPARESLYGPHYSLIALSVGFSLVGIVLWGTLSGSMLPFILRRFGFDPATASAPFVATLVDVTGLVIYFSVASLFLAGTLL